MLYLIALPPLASFFGLRSFAWGDGFLGEDFDFFVLIRGVFGSGI